MKKELILENILETLKKVLPKDKTTFGLHEPLFDGNEWVYVKECLDVGWVSSVGKFVDRFEQDLTDYTGVKRAVAVVNGTAALHICLKLVGVVSNDEVIVPTLTFVATANAVTYCGAIPHFADSEERTLGLDPNKLLSYLEQIAEIRNGECFNIRTGRRIKAVVPMHTFGHPVDLDQLSEVCKRFKLELIEDAAESLGSYYKGRHTGNWGKVSAISFNGNKIVTTGGGGAILTNNVELGKLAKHITTTAKIPHQWSLNHDMIGYNYRLPNINAALGCGQLENLSVFLDKKRALAKTYQEAFQGNEIAQFFIEPAFAKSNYWLNALLVKNGFHTFRDYLLDGLCENNIKARPVWVLMHKLPMYIDNPRMDLSVAENLEKRIINIPSSAFL